MSSASLYPLPLPIAPLSRPEPARRPISFMNARADFHVQHHTIKVSAVFALIELDISGLTHGSVASRAPTACYRSDQRLDCPRTSPQRRVFGGTNRSSSVVNPGIDVERLSRVPAGCDPAPFPTSSV